MGTPSERAQRARHVVPDALVARHHRATRVRLPVTHEYGLPVTHEYGLPVTYECVIHPSVSAGRDPSVLGANRCFD